MFRDKQTTLANTLEVLQARKQRLDVEIGKAQQQLEIVRQRYEQHVAHWMKAGPTVILTDADRSAAARETRRAFFNTFLFGLAIPLVGGLIALILFHRPGP